MIVLALIVLDRAGLLWAHHGNDLETYDGAAAMVSRIIDGDTIEIALPDARAQTATTRIRLWGIDAPELAFADRPAEPFARRSAELAESLVLHQMVRLSLEPARVRDKFDRILAHAALIDGRSLNEAMLAAGLARADDRWPHGLLRRYEQVERAARRRGVGLWATSGGRSAAKETAPAP